MSNELGKDVAVKHFIHHANAQAQMQNMFQGYVRTPVYPVHAELLRELCKTLTSVLSDPTDSVGWERLRDFATFAMDVSATHQQDIQARAQEAEAEAEAAKEASTASLYSVGAKTDD